MQYRCEAASVEGFLQHLACNLVNKGYWFYVTGKIPERKNPKDVDQKLIALYGLELSKWARARRKAQGKANAAYLRHDRFFVILVTKGTHPFLDREMNVQDIRRRPIRFHGYSIGCGEGSDGKHHASVSIREEVFQNLLTYFRGAATHWSADHLARELSEVGFVPYARVRRQLLRLLREVNESRRKAGFEAIPMSALSMARKIVPAFRSPNSTDADHKVEQNGLLTIVKRLVEPPNLDLDPHVGQSTTPGKGESGAVAGDSRREGPH